MARPQNKKRPVTFEMVNVDFNDSEKQEISLWLEDHPTDRFFEVLDIVDAGYKVSISRDEYHDCYVASLTNKKPASNAKVSFVYLLRHSDFSKVCGLLFYYWIVVLAQGENIPMLKTDKYDW